MPIPESETQPTPPPRKKKLKKKLEQLVEKQLDQSQIKNNINDGEKEDIETIQNTGNEGDIGTEILKTVEDETTEQGTSPKKRMRRKKHNAVPE